jgi:hypothetical protein
MSAKAKKETVNLNVALSGILSDVDGHIDYLDNLRNEVRYSLTRDQSIELANVRKAYVEARKGIVAAIALTVA